MLNFLKIRTNLMLSSQAFACLQHGFLRTVENVSIHNFVTTNGVWEIFFFIILTLIFLFLFLGRALDNNICHHNTL